MNNNKPTHRITTMQLVAILLGIKGHPFSHWALMTEATLTGGKKTIRKSESINNLDTKVKGIKWRITRN